MDTKALVLSTLKGSKTPMKSGEISTASGIDKKEVDKAIKALVKEEEVVSSKKCFYACK